MSKDFTRSLRGSLTKDVPSVESTRNKFTDNANNIISSLKGLVKLASTSNERFNSNEFNGQRVAVIKKMQKFLEQFGDNK